MSKKVNPPKKIVEFTQKTVDFYLKLSDKKEKAAKAK